MAKEKVTINGMTEVLPTEEQQRFVQIYRAIMAQVFVRYTPKAERNKWLLPSDGVSEWNLEELEFIRVYRRGDDIKVGIKYYSLPYEGFCKDQCDMALTNVLIAMSKYINLEIQFETLLDIGMNIYELTRKYSVPVIVRDMRNFMTSFVVDFDEMEMTFLPSTVIFHDSNTFESRENLCVSTISIDERDPEQLEKGNIWKSLTLVNCTGALEPGKTDWPPEKYIVLRDKYAKGELGGDYKQETYVDKVSEGSSVTVREVLKSNADHIDGAHEYCMKVLSREG